MSTQPSRESRISSLPEHMQELLRRRLAGQAPEETGIPRADRGGELPASFAQRRLWFLDEFQPGGVEYNSGLGLRIHGSLDITALRTAVTEVVRRHEALRTTFDAVDGRVVQLVHTPESLHIPVEFIDLTTQEAEPARAEGADAAAVAGTLARARLLEPFDLRTGPLLRVLLIRLGADDHVLVLTAHHMVTDGWSLGILTRELSALYTAAVRQEGPAGLPQLPVQYADYAAWQHEQEPTAGQEDAHLTYWRQRLAGTEPLELPTDRPRPATPSTAGAVHRFDVPAETLAGLRRLEREADASLFVQLTAVTQLLLAYYSGQDDIAVGTVTAGRERPELEHLIGFFANTLVLRTHVDRNAAFGAYLADVRAHVLEAFDHRDTPFDRVVEAVAPERVPGRMPLVQAMVVLQNNRAPEVTLPGARVEPFEVSREALPFDFMLEFSEEDDGLVAAIEYRTDLFDPATISRMATHWLHLAQAAVTAPDRPLSQLTAPDGAELERVLGADWSGAVGEPADASLVSAFAERVAAEPDAVALGCGERSLSYAELDAASDRLASALVERGVLTESRVGLLLRRSAEVVVAMLAVVKAGAGYVPLNAGHPDERLRQVVEDSGACLIITDAGLADRARETGVAVLRADATGSADTGLPGAVSAESLAYVMFTSGSTGRPKGVAVTHADVVALARDERFGSGAHGRVLFHSPHAFDAATYEVWVPLLSGGCVVVAESEVTASAVRAAVADRGVTGLWVTAALFGVLAEEDPGCFAGLGEVWTGGDAVPAVAAERMLAACPSTVLVNGYGPTETTTFAVVGRLSHEEVREGRVPLGLPMDNTRAVVLDASLRPVGVGVPGELYLGGHGLARGYEGRAGLTAERFIADPFTPGQRLYRTGDLVRRTEDGRLIFLGRGDDQVKIRGFRIEPAEIQAALERCEGVAGAAVVVREDQPGTKRLIAYLVGDQLDTQAVREEAARALPEYMVPTAFVVLDELPLTPNGKVDRRALPAPELGPDGEYTAPRTETEHILAAIWADVLGTENIGIHDDFFALGGDSITSLKAASRIRAALGVELSPRALFDAPTVADLAVRLHPADADEGIPVASREDGAALPLSFAQERLWFLDDFAPGGTEYNVVSALRLTGGLDVAALQAAVDGLVARHEALRTVFDAVDGHGVQRVLARQEVPVTVVEPGGGPDGEPLAEVLRRVQATPFALREGPLVRVLLVREAAEEHVLVLAMHHIVTDGWSMGVITRELSELYAAALAGREARLPALPLAYGDYAVWQRERFAGDALDGQLGYWREKLAGLEPLELPIDRPRPAVRTSAGALHTFEVPPELAARLRAVGERNGVSLFMTLTAVTKLLLARYANSRDVALGTAVSGRDRAELEGLAGFFVNTLVLRSRIDERRTFAALLGDVRETVLEAFAHQDVPFSRLIEELDPARDTSRTPLVQAMVSLQNTPEAPLVLPGLDCAEVEVPRETAQFDLTVGFREEAEGLRAGIEYSTELFDADTVARLAAHWTALAGALTAAPDVPLLGIGTLTADERERLALEAAATGADVPALAAPELFALRVAAAPEAPAVVQGALTLSYGELDARANQLARHLRQEAGVTLGTRVALLLPRSVELVCAVLAVLKAGGTYVPLDPSYPADRLAHQVTDSAAAVVLTRAEQLAALPETAARVLRLDDPGTREAVAAQDTRDLALTVPLTAGAYVIHTSGSTGLPKGVLVTHAGIASLAAAQAERLDVGPSARVLMFASPGFDASWWELCMALLSGAALVIDEDTDDSRSQGSERGERLGRVVAEQRVTHATLPPALVAALDARDLPAVLTVAGEACPPELVDRCAPGRRMINAYGPTETTVCATMSAPLAPGGGVPPIGTPVTNTRTYVLDDRLRPVPTGVAGELYVAGAGLARGYLNRPGRTAVSFVADPFGGGGRLYRTGDVVRRRADGQLEFVGRGDDQVKVRGFRVEPREIEAVLAAHASVGQAVVLARTDRPGAARLVAYVVAAHPGPDGAVDVAALRAHAAEALPDYMVPAAFVPVDAIPLNANGKVDKAALPEPGASEDAAAHVAPRTEAERVLAGIWAEVLGVERVGVRDNFFDLGGDSILSIQVVSRARRAGFALSSREVFLRQTVAALAAAAGPRDPAAGGSPVLAEQGVVHGPVATTPIREWFFATHPVAPEHFAMSMSFLLAPDLDTGALRTAIAAVLAQHDALRTVFTADGAHLVPEADVDSVFTVHDLTMAVPDPAASGQAVPDPEASGPSASGTASGASADPVDAAWHAVTAGVQAAFRLDRGPLLRVVVGLPGDGTRPRVLFAAHHLVVDGVSWRILLADVATAYARAVAGEDVDLGAKTTSVRQWADRLTAHAAAGGFDAEAAHWVRALEGARTDLPVDLPPHATDAAEGTADPTALTCDNTVAAQETVTVELTAADSEALLNRVSGVYRTRTDDVLLTALARVLRSWTGHDRVAVHLEGHGREELFEDVDLTRTVGWFTSLYPVALRLPEESAGWGSAVTAVKEQMRALPHRGLGYGALRHLATGAAGEAVRALPAPLISFNYHGRFEIAQPEGAADGGLYRAELPLAQGDHSGAEERPHLLDVTGAVQDGRLVFAWTYGTRVHRRATVEALARDFAAELAAFAAHCAEPGAGGCAPSDFPLVTLDQEQVDHLAGDGRGVEDIYPLTPLQEGMLFHALTDGAAPGDEAPAYLEQFACVLDGVPDPAALAAAWQRASDRTDALRVSVSWARTPRPVQVVHREVTVPVTHHDWRDRTERERADGLAALLREERQRGLDLAAAPLQRVHLAQLTGGRVQLVWTFHHLLLDGWSSAALLTDILADCADPDPAAVRPANRTGPGPAAVRPARGAFGDYLRWLSARDHAEGLAFWRDRLAGCAQPVALPYDTRPEWAHRGRSTGRLPVALPPETATGAVEFARRHRVTVNTLVQGAWALLLAQHGASGDVVFGTTVSGRPDELAGAEDILGLFINTLPVRVDTDQNAPVAAWLRALHTAQAEARPYEYVALSDIETELPPGTALFDSLVVFENYPVDTEAADQHGIALRDVQAIESTNYPLTLIAGGSDTLSMTLAYDPDLFTATTAQRLATHLSHALQTLTTHPEHPLNTLPLTPHEERAQVLGADWSGAVGERADASLVSAFAERVAASPDAVALVCGERSLSYAELDAAADRLAPVLVERGVRAESRVGLLLERSAEVVVSMLAVLKAGAAYVPLNAVFPDEGLRQVVGDSGACQVLTDAGLASRASGLGVPVVRADQDAAGEAPVAAAPAADALAYVMFTSGSTGRPKGVAVTHADVVALARDERFGSGAHGRVLFHSPHAFDAATYEVWVPLLNGGCVVVAEGEVTASAVRAAVADQGVTGLWVTAALFGVLAEEDPGCFAGLGEVWTGGDAVPAVAAERMLAACPSTVLVNGYGPTETTTFAVVGRLSHEEVREGRVPLGLPMDNTRAVVLDASLRPVGIGVPGELYLGGHGLARGYEGRADLTAERFIADPFTPGQRLYRTGDLVRREADGRLTFLGRGDDQVKIRGFRIEPAEIQAALERCEGVARAAVVVREDQPGTKRLAAYLVGDALDIETVREEAARALPEYMVPTAFVVLDELPLTPNGKVDRRALPAPELDGGQEYTAPRTETERILAAVWAEVLGVERIGVHDDFFTLGGDSITSIQVVSRARREGLALSSRDVFVGQTVAGLSAELDQAAREAGEQGAAEPGTEATDAGPLDPTPVGEWFFATHPVAPEHFSMTMSFELDGAADAAALRTAVASVLARHGMLRATFAPGADGCWTGRIPEDGGTEGVFSAHDLRDAAEPRACWERLVREAQRGFDLASGPLVRVLHGVRQDGAADWLTLVAHHLVIDGVSWRILLEDLETAYAQARAGGPVSLGAGTTPVRQWAALLHAHVAAGGFDDQLDHWRTTTDEAAAELPVDHPEGANTGAELDMVVTTLTPDQTRALRYRVPGRFRSGVNDVLLAALARVLADWTGRERTLVNLEGHGRADLFDEVDLSGTVGWFTSIYPLALEARTDQNWAQQVKAVKRRLRAVPDQGVGYGALRYLSAPETPAARALADAPQPQISFNYLGRFDVTADHAAGGGAAGNGGPGTEHGPRPLVQSELDIVGQDYSPHEARPHLIDVGAVVQGEELTLTWSYSSRMYDRATMEGLAAALATSLAELAEDGGAGR